MKDQEKVKILAEGANNMLGDYIATSHISANMTNNLIGMWLIDALLRTETLSKENLDYLERECPEYLAAASDPRLSDTASALAASGTRSSMFTSVDIRMNTASRGVLLRS